MGVNVRVISLNFVISNGYSNSSEANLMLRNIYPLLLSLLLLTAFGTGSCGSESTSEPMQQDTTGRSDSTDTIDTNDTVDSTDSVDRDTLRLGSFEGETGAGGQCVWVEPYRKSDGSCVRGHWRSAPGETCPWVGTVYKECD